MTMKGGVTLCKMLKREPDILEVHKKHFRIYFVAVILGPIDLEEGPNMALGTRHACSISL